MKTVCIIQHGPTLMDFDRHDVWCEYHDAGDWLELRQWGISKKRFDEELVGPVEMSQGQFHPYYSIPKDAPFRQRELLEVGVRAALPDGQQFDGSAVIVSGEITCLNLFLPQFRNVMLYSAPEAPEENSSALESIPFFTSGLRTVNLKIETRRALACVQLVDSFGVPLTD